MCASIPGIFICTNCPGSMHCAIPGDSRIMTYRFGPTHSFSRMRTRSLMRATDILPSNRQRTAAKITYLSNCSITINERAFDKPQHQRKDPNGCTRREIVLAAACSTRRPGAAKRGSDRPRNRCSSAAARIRRRSPPPRVRAPSVRESSRYDACARSARLFNPIEEDPAARRCRDRRRGTPPCRSP